MPDHAVYNVYGEADIETVENALDTARSDLDGDPTKGDLLVRLAEAYTGWSAVDD